MKQIFKQKVTMACILFMTIIITACSKGNSYHFETPKDALKACESELNNLSRKKKFDIKELTEITNRWIALQDSSIHCIATTVNTDDYAPVINSFFKVSDSIRSQITSLAYSLPRTMNDVIYLRVNITYGRESIEENEDYEKALDFYESLDKNNIIDSPEEAMKAYQELFKRIDQVKKENDLLEYIKEEDRCFRSLLKHQASVKPEIVEEISEETENFFNKLQYAVSKQNEAQNKRLLAFLNIRINRRMIQYAEAYVSDIEKGVKITDESRETYRWAILQPYMTIDKYMAAYLNKEQKESLMEIGRKLPEYLSYIDELQTQITKKDKEKLTERIKNVLLSMTIKQSI